MAKKSAAAKARRRAKNEAHRRAVEAQCAALKAAGSFCSNCAHCSPYPTPGRKGEVICDLDSDFHGYAITKPERVCPRWEART